MPRSYAEILVDLDATQLVEGPLPTWQNKGTVAGDFKSPSGAVPNVTTQQGVKGVTLNGTTQYYTGPAAPVGITGSAARTVEAWILNPAAADEETIFTWGRRGGPDGSNCSFNHGLNAAFGAVGHWGAADLGWNGKVATGRWTYVAYTYDGTMASVYADGQLANSRDVTLDTWAFDNTQNGNPLPGTFMDMGPTIIITTPIFLPVVQAYDVDPVHFGVVIVVNMMIGLVTPPVGLSRQPLKSVTRTIEFTTNEKAARSEPSAPVIAIASRCRPVTVLFEPIL
jgi:hypothetical protein